MFRYDRRCGYYNLSNYKNTKKLSGLFEYDFNNFTPHSTLHTPHITLYTLHSTMPTPHFTLYTPHSTLSTPHFSLHTLHSTIYTLHSTPYTLHFTLETGHSTLYTVHFHVICFCDPLCALHSGLFFHLVFSTCAFSTLHCFDPGLQNPHRGWELGPMSCDIGGWSIDFA